MNNFLLPTIPGRSKTVLSVAPVLETGGLQNELDTFSMFSLGGPKGRRVQFDSFLQALSNTGRFFCTNIITAVLHRLAGTWAARLWAMLPQGYARTDKLTGLRETEKFGSLDGGASARRYLRRCRPSSGATKHQSKGCCELRDKPSHSGNKPFLFLFHFMSLNRSSLITPERSPSTLGVSSVFCFLCPLFHS